MKILVYGINFAPELTGIGKYTGEMVEWLAAQGHEVRVVAAPPYYPSWKVAQGHVNGYTQQPWKGATVWRCPLWVPGKPGGLKRILHLASFATASLPVMLRQVLWRPDVVWLAAPAFVCAPGAVLTAKLAGAASWIHIQDFEVDVAFDTGLLKGQRLRSLALGLERWMLRRFSKVSTISGKMLEKLREKQVQPERIASFPNWVDTDFICPRAKPECDALRDELGIPRDAVVALYSGSLGAKAGLGIVPQVAAALQQRCPNLVLLVCGDGVMKPQLEAAAANHPSLRVMPLQPYERFTTLMSMADIHLLPQEPGVADLVMPSKLGAMLASGRPVLATVEPGTELHNVVQGCGLTTPPGHAGRMADALLQLAENAPMRAQMGTAARAWAQANLAKTTVLRRFESQLAELCAARH